MLIYALDTDFYTLKEIEKDIKEDPRDSLELFTNTANLWKAYEEKKPDLVIVELEAYSSLILLERIRKDNPDQSVILSHKENKLPLQVLELRADGLLPKPIDKEKLKELLFKIKHPFLAKTRWKPEKTETA